MVKKAKLDILEIAPEELVVEAPQGEVIPEAGENGPSGGQTGGNFRSMVLRWIRKPLLWVILISCTVLGLAAGISIIFYQNLEEDGPTAQNRQAVPVTSRMEQGVLCEGMVIDQKDEKGNIRLVFCDVVLELENRKTVSAVDGDRIDVRSVIYDVLKSEPPQEGLSPEGRGRLKEKIKNGLKGLFRENPVKEVFFMRYELD